MPPRVVILKLHVSVELHVLQIKSRQGRNATLIDLNPRFQKQSSASSVLVVPRSTSTSYQR